MRKTLIITFLLIQILLSACSGTPTPAVTPADLTALTGTTWMWTGMTTPVQHTDIVVPQNYTLRFQDDGAVNIKADCNNASGSYKVEDESIQIEIGPMTRAVCPPGSYSDDFNKYLGSAANYFFKDGVLYIDLAADGGRMTFTPFEEISAAATEAPVSDPLLANPWQWTSFINPVEKYTVETPENYQLTFQTDGTVDIKTDCNLASGTYTTEGKKISISVGPMTMAACPPGSRSEEFIKYLGYAAIYFFQDGDLLIDLFADGGTMRFAPLD